MLHMILADSELEQVPAEIADDKPILWTARRRARKPTELILNSSLHHRAMRKLEDAERRGRPDIVHSCLLLAQDSPLNSEGLLRTYVHTRWDRVITVDPSANLPRSYNRFEGLMEQLFMAGVVPPEKPLLTLERSTLAELVRKIKPKKTIAFSENGERKKLGGVFEGVSSDEEACVIVGGFPHGDYSSDVKALTDDYVCIYPKLLTGPAVWVRAIHAFEQKFGVL